ncbi:hypothetical protein M0R45_030394 [Rubus argutus]|uniref:Uncharacterized protein n=1 Tax=Rubus argutus TaxID=59490 RepID=A0AAW1WB90_RUBAR
MPGLNLNIIAQLCRHLQSPNKSEPKFTIDQSIDLKTQEPRPCSSSSSTATSPILCPRVATPPLLLPSSTHVALFQQPICQPVLLMPQSHDGAHSRSHRHSPSQVAQFFQTSTPQICRRCYSLSVYCHRFQTTI